MKKALFIKAMSLILALLMVFTAAPMLQGVSAAAYTGIMHQNLEKWVDYKYDGVGLAFIGCGIFSLANCVGYMTGRQMDVVQVADWAYARGYFNGEVGTYGNTFYQNVGKEYGPLFGFNIDANNGKGYYGSIYDTRLVDHLKAGGTAVIHVENHFMALVGYNSSNGMYHVYNSTPGTIDGTSYTNGDVWVTGTQLNTGDDKVNWYVLVYPAAVDSTKPVISNIKVTNVSFSGYTVSCTVTDNHLVDKVAFPTWTLANGQDDLNADWWNTQKGSQNGNTFTFRVNITDHKNEAGYYTTHIYAVDKKGNTVSASVGDVQVPADAQKPVISNVEYTEVSAKGYTVSCTVKDNWEVAAVAFPTWTVQNGQDDLKADWWNTQKGTKDGNRYIFRINASEHNNETDGYVTHIYAKDRAGNVEVVNLEPVKLMNDTSKPVISDAKITNITAVGYTVTCKITDNWGINSVSFPTWTLLNNQDDIKWYTNQGTANGDTYTFKVKTSDHGGEKGYYVTHIYATDCAGNTASFELDAVEVKDPLLKITLASNSGYNIKDALLTKVKPGTTVAELLSKLEDGELEVQDKNGKKLAEKTAVSTGSTVNLYLGGKLIDTVTLVASGDVNGDGVVDTTDYMQVKASILGSFELSKTESLAADVDRNGSIDTTDYMRIKAHILGSFRL